MIRKASLLALLAGVCLLPAESGLLRLAMPDAAVLVGVRLDQIRSSPLAQAIFSEVDTPGSEIKKAIALLGFNPFTDLNEVLIAAPSPTAKQRALILVRGTFDPARLPTLAKMGGATVSTVEGIDIFTGKQDKQEFSLAALEASTLVMGDPESVRGAVARRAAGSQLSPKLLAKVEELSKAYDIWGATLVPPGQMAKGVPSPQLQGMLKGDVLQSIREASGGLRLGKDIQMAFEVVTRSEKDATALGDVFKFFTGLALTQGKPEQAKLLENLKLNVEGTRVRFGWTVPEQEVAKMIEAQKKALAAQRRSTPAKKAEPAAPSGEVVIYSSPQDMGVVKLPPPK